MATKHDHAIISVVYVDLTMIFIYYFRAFRELKKICIEYGTEEDGYIDYVKGANIAGFVKVADAMLAQGIV